MNLLLDQMFDISVKNALKESGFNVSSVSEFGLARADDSEIMEFATRKKQLLITLDEHFGDWSVLPLDRHHGVIRIKAKPSTSVVIISIIKSFLVQHRESNFTNKLVIVSSKNIRWISTSDS